MIDNTAVTLYYPPPPTLDHMLSLITISNGHPLPTKEGLSRTGASGTARCSGGLAAHALRLGDLSRSGAAVRNPERHRLTTLRCRSRIGACSGAVGSPLEVVFGRHASAEAGERLRPSIEVT